MATWYNDVGYNTCFDSWVSNIVGTYYKYTYYEYHLQRYAGLQIKACHLVITLWHRYSEVMSQDSVGRIIISEKKNDIAIITSELQKCSRQKMIRIIIWN